jgi:lambda repressor-like predicted transcriptional regulator
MPQNAQGMHPADIVAAIRKQHGTCRALAKRLEVSPSAIAHVIQDPLYSTRLERRLALAIGVSLHAIWPDRWTEAGEALPRSQRSQGAPPHRIISSQKQKAA